MLALLSSNDVLSCLQTKSHEHDHTHESYHLRLASSFRAWTRPACARPAAATRSTLATLCLVPPKQPGPGKAAHPPFAATPAPMQRKPASRKDDGAAVSIGRACPRWPRNRSLPRREAAAGQPGPLRGRHAVGAASLFPRRICPPLSPPGPSHPHTRMCARSLACACTRIYTRSRCSIVISSLAFAGPVVELGLQLKKGECELCVVFQSVSHWRASWIEVAVSCEARE